MICISRKIPIETNCDSRPLKHSYFEFPHLTRSDQNYVNIIAENGNVSICQRSNNFSNPVTTFSMSNTSI